LSPLNTLYGRSELLTRLVSRSNICMQAVEQLRSTCQCHNLGCLRGDRSQCTCFSTILSCCCNLVFLADGSAMACVHLNVSSVVGAVVAATGAGLSSASEELCFEESLCLLSDGVSATLCKDPFVLGFGFTICKDRLRASKPCYYKSDR